MIETNDHGKMLHRPQKRRTRRRKTGQPKSSALLYRLADVPDVLVCSATGPVVLDRDVVSVSVCTHHPSGMSASCQVYVTEG
jgi:hypothetical protein